MRLVITLVSALLLAACAPHPDTSSEPLSAAVYVQTPVSEAEGRNVRLIGRIEAAGESNLGFPVGGVLEAIPVKIGDRVRKGQVLASLDTTALGAGTAQARAELEQARRELGRIEALVERQLLPRQQRDDASTRVELAAAVLRSAANAQRYGRVVAGADGVVLERLAEAGEVVLPGQPVLRISSEADSWLLRVQVADRDAAALTPGLPALVTLDAFPGVEYEASVLRLGGQASSGSGAIEAELQVVAAPGQLRSGLVAKARIAPYPGAALTVPVTALLRADNGRGSLMVIVDDTARLRDVALGEIWWDRIQVTDGLAPDEQVVVAGASYVDDGETIRILAGP